jgi:uridine phosphorylase
MKMPKKQTFKSAEVVSTKENRQYHIGLAPKEVSEYILLCGDPQRARRVAGYFDTNEGEITSREYVTITGKYKGERVTVMATGMGPDNTEIAIIELLQITKNPTFIRIGSSGALKKGIKLAELVISKGACRLENTSTKYVFEGFPAVAHHEVVLSLLMACKKLGTPHHLGITATASGFYGAQGRKVPGFPMPRDVDLPAKLDEMNVSNMEMEMSSLLTLSSLANVRAGGVCAIYAQRHENVFIDTKTKDLAEKRCIEAGLTAIEFLRRIDLEKGKGKFWIPRI